MTENAREKRLRRLAITQGLYVTKSRSRTEPWGGYMIVHAETNGVVAGGSPFPYFLDLNEVEEWLAPG